MILVIQFWGRPATEYKALPVVQLKTKEMENCDKIKRILKLK